MTGVRLLYGTDRLPNHTIRARYQIARGRSGATKLRLNSVKLPAEAWGSGETDHAARTTAMRSWLLTATTMN
jgi:hypothetical protein